MRESWIERKAQQAKENSNAVNRRENYREDRARIDAEPAGWEAAWENSRAAAWLGVPILFIMGGFVAIGPETYFDGVLSGVAMGTAAISAIVLFLFAGIATLLGWIGE